MSLLRLILPIACALVASACAGVGSSNRGDMIIVAGQESLLAGALGLGTELPAGCKFTGGEVNGRVVRGTYACGSVEVGIEAAPDAAVASTPPRFVVSTTRGPQVDSLVAAIDARLRQIESRVRWSSPAADRGSHSPRARLLWLGIVLLLFPLWPLLLDLRTVFGNGANDGTGRLGAGIRIVGLVVLFGAARVATARLWDGDPAVFGGMVATAAFLWLAVGGFFGYASTARDDWPALVAFGVALVVREGMTLHSIDALELSFSRDLFDRHSVLWPLLQVYAVAFARDPQGAIMHANGIVGAAATLPLFVFVRQRTGSRLAAFSCAMMFATQALVARYAPTDGTFSLLLATWFGGLALLSDAGLGPRGLVGGAGLLAIAATSRIEGSTLLVASLLMLQPAIWWRAITRSPWCALGAAALAASIGAVQAVALLSFYLGSPALTANAVPTFAPWVEEGIWPGVMHPPSFMVLMLIGTTVGLLPRYRLGLASALGSLVILALCLRSHETAIMHHRLAPTFAAQTITAGIAVWVAASAFARWPRFAWLTPFAVALYFLWADHGYLTRKFLFNEEFEMARAHLAVDGEPVPNCSLLMMTSLVPLDADLHGFEKVVPGMPTIDCAKVDCLRELRPDRCTYYFRSAACYFHTNGLPQTDTAVAPLVDACRTFEENARLEVVELRTIWPLETFPASRWYFPRRADVGIFRAYPK